MRFRLRKESFKADQAVVGREGAQGWIQEVRGRDPGQLLSEEVVAYVKHLFLT